MLRKQTQNAGGLSWLVPIHNSVEYKDSDVYDARNEINSISGSRNSVESCTSPLVLNCPYLWDHTFRCFNPKTRQSLNSVASYLETCMGVHRCTKQIVRKIICETHLGIDGNEDTDMARSGSEHDVFGFEPDVSYRFSEITKRIKEWSKLN